MKNCLSKNQKYCSHENKNYVNAYKHHMPDAKHNSASPFRLHVIDD